MTPNVFYLLIFIAFCKLLPICTLVLTKDYDDIEIGMSMIKQHCDIYLANMVCLFSYGWYSFMEAVAILKRIT